MLLCLQDVSTNTTKSKQQATTMVKKILKLVTAFTPKKTYEFLPEIWNLIKEYAVPQYVEPIKIGERFINYSTEIEDGITYLNHVYLCVRVEDRVHSFENQKKWKSPIIKTAKYVTLQTLRPHPRNHSRLVLSRFKDEGEFHHYELFCIRRSVAGLQTCRKYLRRNEVMYWDTDKPHKDELITEYPFRKTWDPELPCQFIKTKVKKLHRNMFTTTEDNNMVGYYGRGTGFHVCSELNLTP
jgi:hypothetical protein